VRSIDILYIGRSLSYGFFGHSFVKVDIYSIVVLIMYFVSGYIRFENTVFGPLLAALSSSPFEREYQTR
jgi:hypothetical protein